ncbi:small RNA 2'-O-methyltransferase [Sitodiplosis mosellana]|uniref:small RNA 2'-O-methyltransferase n=1 Tax=Sitodiplosis mosellana TaxID=263140 RepID=UPI0024450D03|nr:small RNA 2'-O-methyltransferase [Sitodiplosis mosellana]
MAKSNQISEYEFNLDLRDTFRSLSYYHTDEEGGDKQLKFDPPVYQARYSAINSILTMKEWIPHIKKVTEFGCADMSLVLLIRRNDHLQHILQIDIDDELLKRFEQRAAPLTWEYLSRRKLPLITDVYHGSVDSPHECLLDSDVVICVELIEHLFPETEQNLPQNIFGFIKPKIAVFTTPNADFNILFGSSKFENGFRHEDHKFEWTQQQFKDWAQNICIRYPNYRFSVSGVGELPTDADEQLGKCSQMATFVRKDMLPLLNGLDATDDVTPPVDESDTEEVVFPIEKFKYKLLFSKEFPYDQDSRSLDEKILDDVKYFINRHLYDDDLYFDQEKNICEFPVEDIFRHVHDASDLNEMRSIIRKEFVINDKDCVEHKLPEESGSEFSEYDDEDGEDVKHVEDAEDEDKDEVSTENGSSKPVTTADPDDEDWD